MKIKLNQLVGKIACKTTDNRVRPEDGQYPRVGWIHDTGFSIAQNQVKYEYIQIDKSHHYQFVLGNKQPYLDYMNTNGWKSGRKDAKERFEKLIEDFKEYDSNVKYIEVVRERGKFAIVDGLHRASILFTRDPEQEVEIKTIICRGFSNLRM
jgi:hypothetical protein